MGCPVHLVCPCPCPAPLLSSVSMKCVELTAVKSLKKVEGVDKANRSDCYSNYRDAGKDAPHSVSLTAGFSAPPMSKMFIF